MHAIKTGNPVLANVLGGLHVSRDHAFFDQAVRIVARHSTDTFYGSIFAYVNTRLWNIELDSSPFAAIAGKQSINFVQVTNVILHLFGHGRLLVAGQEVGNLGVGQASPGFHDRFIKFRARDLAVFVHAHLTDHAEPLDLGIQRAETVRQHLRQHGYDTIGEVHRRTASDRLLVDGRPDLDVVADIGYGDQEPEAFAGRLGIYSVIEITGVCTIDRDQVDITKIDAAFLCRCRHLLAKVISLFADRLRPVGRYAVRMNRYVCRNALVIGCPDHLGNLAGRLLPLRRIIENPRDDDVSVLCLAGPALADQDAMREPGIVRNDHADSTFANELSCDLFDAAFEDLDEIALRTTAPVLPDDPHSNTIPMEKRTHFPR